MDTIPLLVFELLNGVVWGLIFAMVVLGLSLTFGLMNLMNVAHSSFYMLGAMVTASLVTNHGYGFVLSTVVATAAVTALGFVANTLVLSRVVGSEPIIGLLATAGLLLVLDSLALALFGSTPIAVAAPVDGYLEVAGVFYPLYRLVVAGIATAAIAGAFLFIRLTKYGLWMRAVPQSRELAEIAGVSKRRVSQVTILLGTFLAALAGALITPIASAQFQMGLTILATGFIVVVVGGGSSLVGALVVAMLLGVLRGVAAAFMAPTVADVASLAVLLPVLALRPSGLFGGRDA